MKRQKKRKGVFSIFLVMVFACVFVAGLWYLWGNGKNSSIAEDAPTVQKVINNSSETLLTIPATFYNYRYDDEIKYGTRTQGAQSCEDNYETPFGYFNGVASGWLKERNALYGCYLGNFYKYWKDIIKTNGYNWCQANYYKFRWAQNLANRSGNYDAVVQGIVNSKLSSGDGVVDKAELAKGDILQNAADGSTYILPFFDTEFLATTRESVALGAVKDNVGFPFREVYSETEGKHYVFDSSKDVVRFSGMKGSSYDATNDEYYYGENGQLEYYYNKNQVTYNNSAGFFPFNNNNDTQMSQLDYGFGVKMVIPFYITEDGLQPVEEGNHQPMEFNFSGDDDVWIFIDGELVLDLGGMHAQTTGKIEFANSVCVTDGDTDGSQHMKITTNTVAYNKGTTVSTVGTNNFEASNSTLKSKKVEYKPITKGGEEGIHYLTIFYMERGMYDSNLKIDFNFFTYDIEEEVVQVTPTPSPSPTPVATPTLGPTNEPTDENAGTLSVWNVLDDSNVNELFKNKVQDMAEDDIFSYKIANKGTDANEVGSSGIVYPSGVLSARYRTAWNEYLTSSSQRLAYLSWGQEYVPDKVRVFVDMASIETAIQKSSKYKSDYPATSMKIEISGSSKSSENGNHLMSESTVSGLYYYDVPRGASFKFDNSEGSARLMVETKRTITDDMEGAIAYKYLSYDDSYSSTIKITLQDDTDTTKNPPSTAA